MEENSQQPPVEERLRELWAAKLPIAPTSVNDNFFDLGGHSLLAADLLLDVYREFGVEVEPFVLFLKPTIAELATVITASLAEER